jgi:hypothetical protein
MILVAPNMPRQLPRHAAKIAVAFVICTTASIAHGQVYKCTDGTGTTSYSDWPCGAGSKPLKLPDDTKGSNTNPNVCAQLLDETQRLAAEAERNAKRGRAESPRSLNQRQALTKQYETRCVGISRSEPIPK